MSTETQPPENAPRVALEEGTSNPDLTVALAARGDYTSGNPFEDIDDTLDGVSVDDDAEELVEEQGWVDQYEELDKQQLAAVVSLLRRLFRQRHFGPFEHIYATFSMEGVSRVTMAQITRQRHATFDVTSMRYTGQSGATFTIPRSLTDPDHATREGTVDVDDDQLESLIAVMEEHYERCVELYDGLRESGVPAEDARYVLPMGTEVSLTMSANFRATCHVIDVRRAANAQWEIQDVASDMVQALSDWAPICTYLYEEYGPFANAP